MKKKAFKAAFPYTLPICVGFLFLGMSYGFMMRSKGFSFVYPLCMSFFIYAGSMEFVTANLLLSAFNPVYAFFLTLMVNARHLFYGISMLEKYKNTGWKKFYLIFGMCDESFTVNCTVDPPEDVDRGWFMFFVNALNQFYWVTGATVGALLGYVITAGGSFPSGKIRKGRKRVVIVPSTTTATVIICCVIVIVIFFFLLPWLRPDLYIRILLYDGDSSDPCILSFCCLA